MNRVLRYIGFIVLVAFTSEICAQKTFQPKATQFDWKGIIYRKETAWEARIHNNGALLGVNVGEIKTYFRTNYYHISIGYLRDPREKRQNRNLSLSLNSRSKSFTFGKQNSILNIRGGFGVKKFISEKAKRKGIAVGYDYNFGPSIALLKPVYLDLIYKIDGGGTNERELRSQRYTEDTAEKFTTYNDVFGGSGFFKGFEELSIVPGLQGKLGLFFSMGAFDKYIKSFEVGVMGDIYIKKIPIMIETEAISNKPYFFNFYIKFIMGKRSN